MDRMQEMFGLAMHLLGEPMEPPNINYQRICNIAYILERRRIHVVPSRVEYNPGTGRCYSPRSHESGGDLSTNLETDVCEIIHSPKWEKDRMICGKFDKKGMAKLRRLKEDIAEYGPDRLVKRCAVRERQVA
jgi:hypothetical protein